MRENFEFKTELNFARPTSLNEFFNQIISVYPNIEHDKSKFIQLIIKVLLDDPIRTRSLRKEIEEKQLDFELDKNFPLNDFVDAACEYLKVSNVHDTEAEKFKKIKYII